MPKPLNANLNHENWRLYVASFVPSLRGNPNKPKILHQLKQGRG